MFPLQNAFQALQQIYGTASPQSRADAVTSPPRSPDSSLKCTTSHHVVGRPITHTKLGCRVAYHYLSAVGQHAPTMYGTVCTSSSTTNHVCNALNAWTIKQSEPANGSLYGRPHSRSDIDDRVVCVMHTQTPTSSDLYLAGDLLTMPCFTVPMALLQQAHASNGRRQAQTAE